jgi:hypothetical protein
MANQPQLNQAIAEQFRVQTTLCLSSKVIVITEDQLELRVQDGMQQLSTRDSWIAPLGILVGCLTTLITTDFKNFSWVTSGTLKGIYIAATVGSCVWLVTSLLRVAKFGRREFMASIRTAGSQFNYSPASAESAVTQSADAVGVAGTQRTVAVASSLQCRQCGSILPDPIQGQVARCPNCGTVN